MAQLVKVKMKTSMAGPNGCFGIGQVIAVSQVEADDLIAGGFAERVGALDASPATESASLEGGETTVVEHKPTGRKRGSRG